MLKQSDEVYDLPMGPSVRSDQSTAKALTRTWVYPRNLSQVPGHWLAWKIYAGYSSGTFFGKLHPCHK